MDDIVVFGPDCMEVEELINSLKKEFEITDMGRASWLVGLQITYGDEGIHILQKSYIQNGLR